MIFPFSLTASFVDLAILVFNPWQDPQLFDLCFLHWMTPSCESTAQSAKFLVIGSSAEDLVEENIDANGLKQRVSQELHSNR